MRLVLGAEPHNLRNMSLLIDVNQKGPPCSGVVTPKSHRREDICRDVIGLKPASV